MVCSIATGDLSAQRFNSPEVFIPIPPCPSARDDGGSRQHTIISKGDTNDRNADSPLRHFDRSGAEWRNLTPQMAKTPTRHSSFRPKRSEVEKSHSPMVCSIATGDLSTQRFNSPEVFIPIPPCPSARDDGGGRQHTVISKEQMTETPPCPVVISTEAKRSGEISRLKWQKRCLPLVISTKAQRSS